jgi:hypothetical protein
MSVSIQKQRGAVTFKADKGLNPEALQKVATHRCWHIYIYI